MTDINKPRDGEGNHPWIRTANGGRFYYLDMDGTQYDIDVAAAALSRLCRYAGHLSDEFDDDIYSVAQHSVYVYRLLRMIDASPSACLWGLLHDVPEAYFVDLPSPLKGIIPEYGALEDDSAAAFRDAFDIPFSDEIHDKVKWADYQLYFAERLDLTTIPAGEEDLTPLPLYMLDQIDPEFYLWRPRHARQQFLKAHAEAKKLCKESAYANAS